MKQSFPFSGSFSLPLRDNQPTSAVSALIKQTNREDGHSNFRTSMVKQTKVSKDSR